MFNDEAQYCILYQHLTCQQVAANTAKILQCGKHIFQQKEHNLATKFHNRIMSNYQ